MCVCWCVYVFLSIAACFSLRASRVIFSCVLVVCALSCVCVCV